MTVEKLRTALAATGIDSRAYSLEGERNGEARYCLEKSGRRWCVYFAPN